MYLKALTFIAALAPLVLGMLPEPSATSNAPLGTANSIAAIKTQIMPAIPAGVAAKPCPPEATARRVHRESLHECCVQMLMYSSAEGRPDLCLTVQGGQLTSGAEIGMYVTNLTQWRTSAEIIAITAARTKMLNQNGKNGIWEPQQVLMVVKSDHRMILFVSVSVMIKRTLLDLILRSVSISTPTRIKHRNGLLPLEVWGTVRVSSPLWHGRRRNVIAMLMCAGSKCIDIRGDSFPYTSDTWNSLRDVQVWDCALGSDGKPMYNPQQVGRPSSGVDLHAQMLID
jgi:hypothetical protein